MTALVTILLLFLVVLIVRYILLLWLGYLHHIESRGRARGGRAQPPVTIIVPVFNEETVIEAALRSLLALRYPEFDVIVVDDGSTDARSSRVPRSRAVRRRRRCGWCRRRTAEKRARSTPASRSRGTTTCSAWTATRGSTPIRCARRCGISPIRASARSPET